jgi:hypothetical protein
MRRPGVPADGQRPPSFTVARLPTCLHGRPPRYGFPSIFGRSISSLSAGSFHMDANVWVQLYSLLSTRFPILSAHHLIGRSLHAHFRPRSEGGHFQ